MALTAYLAAVNRILQNPVPSPPLYTTADLTVYINTARAQLAGDAECVLGTGTLLLTNAVSSYLFSSFATFSTGGAALTGILGPLAVRQMSVTKASAALPTIMVGRPWEYLQRWYLNTGAAVATGQPKYWAQHGRGQKGSFVVTPTPSAADYTVAAECTLLPVALVDDTTAEAIPYPWTDAIPYYAAYLAYLSAQRATDADQMFARYREFVMRATEMATPTRFPDNFRGGLAARIAASKQPVTVRPQQGGGGG